MFDSIMQQKSLGKNMFAFWMVRKEEEKANKMSEMTLGYFDVKKFAGELNWYPVEFKYMYAIQLDDIKVNGKSIGLECNQKEGKKCLVTIDSGTSHLAMPTWAY